MWAAPETPSDEEARVDGKAGRPHTCIHYVCMHVRPGTRDGWRCAALASAALAVMRSSFRTSHARSPQSPARPDQTRGAARGLHWNSVTSSSRDGLQKMESTVGLAATCGGLVKARVSVSLVARAAGQTIETTSRLGTSAKAKLHNGTTTPCVNHSRTDHVAALGDAQSKVRLLHAMGVLFFGCFLIDAFCIFYQPWAMFRFQKERMR